MPKKVKGKKDSYTLTAKEERQKFDQDTKEYVAYLIEEWLYSSPKSVIKDSARVVVRALQARGV